MGNFENGNHAQKYKILSVVDDFKPRLTRTVTARERGEELKSWLWKFFKSGNIKLISLIFIDYSLVSSLFVPTYWSVVCGYIFYLAKVDAKSEVIRSVLEHQTGPFTFYQFEPKHETTAWNGGFYIKKFRNLSRSCISNQLCYCGFSNRTFHIENIQIYFDSKGYILPLQSVNFKL